jgi:hypothetical protein
MTNLNWRSAHDLIVKGGITVGKGEMWLVWTNGCDWNDLHILLWPAALLERRLKDPNIVRGKVRFAALVTDPTENAHGKVKAKESV